MLLGLDLPAGRIGVAPFGAHDDPLWVDVAAGQPAAQKLFGAAIGSGRIKIANAALPGCVQNIVGMALHGRNVIVALQVVGVAQIDIARSAQSGQPKAQGRDPELSAA